MADAAEAGAITAVTLVASTLSFLGSAAIVVTYAAVPRVQRFSYRIIAWLAAADCLASVSYFIHAPTPLVTLVQPYSPTCIAGAVLSQFMDVATFLWTVCVSLTVYMVLVRRSPASELRMAERAFHAVCWGLPLLLTVVAGGAGSFGDAGTWCWITAEFQGLRLGLYYLPLVGCIAAVGAVAWLTRTGVRASPAVKPEQKPLVARRILLFFVVFALLRLPSIVNRLQQAAAPPGSPPVFVLSLLHATFSPLQGFANALIYGFNSLVITEYGHIVARCRGQGAEQAHGELEGRSSSAGRHVGSRLGSPVRNELELMDEPPSAAGVAAGATTEPGSARVGGRGEGAAGPRAGRPKSNIGASVFGNLARVPSSSVVVNPLSTAQRPQSDVKQPGTGSDARRVSGGPSGLSPASAAGSDSRTVRAAAGSGEEGPADPVHGAFFRVSTWREGEGDSE